MTPVEISAGRLHLRPWAAYDEDALVRLFSDPVTARWTPAPVPFTQDDAVTRLTEGYPAMWETGTGATWAVVDSVSAAVLAWVAVFDIRDGRGEVGWGCLPEARGGGVTTEAVAAACRWAFGQLELEVLTATIAVGNWASLAVAQKCGFQVEGTLRAHMLQRGTRLDAWVATRLASDEEVDRRPLPSPPTLTDGVVTLRAFTGEDAADVARACDDPETARWLPVPVPYTLEDGRQYVEDICPSMWADGSAANFAVVDATTGELLGDVGVKLPFRDPLRYGEVGYWTAPWARGRGAAGRATALVTRWALEELGLNRVELLADVDNGPSLRAAQKAGFVREGVARRARPRRDGTGADMAVFALTTDDR